MTILIAEGFENYQAALAPTAYDPGWPVMDAPDTGKCVHMTNGADVMAWATGSAPSVGTWRRVSVRLCFNSFGAPMPEVVAVLGFAESSSLSATSSDARLDFVTATREFRFRVMATSQVETQNVVVAGQWFHVECLFEYADPGQQEVYVNGRLVCKATVDATAEPWLYFATGGDSMFLCDDVLVTEHATKPALLGPGVKVLPAIPTSSTSGEWTGSDADSVDNHLLVDDGDEASLDYIESVAGSGDTDLYGHGMVFPDNTEVLALQVRAAASRDDLGDDDFSVVVGSGASEVATPLLLGVGPPAWRHGAFVETDPDTGASWSKAAAEAATIGVRS